MLHTNVHCTHNTHNAKFFPYFLETLIVCLSVSFYSLVIAYIITCSKTKIIYFFIYIIELIELALVFFTEYKYNCSLY